jgi:hypothetical protein
MNALLRRIECFTKRRKKLLTVFEQNNRVAIMPA